MQAGIIDEDVAGLVESLFNADDSVHEQLHLAVRTQVCFWTRASELRCSRCTGAKKVLVTWYTEALTFFRLSGIAGSTGSPVSMNAVNQAGLLK